MGRLPRRSRARTPSCAAPSTIPIRSAAPATYAARSDDAAGQLTRHLGDEEGLIIPLILDRGEAGLGVG
jgi:hypothetical protein